MAEFVKVDGLRELDRKLAELPAAVGFKALRSAMMQATKPMFAAAKANALSTGIKNYDSGATAAAMGRWTRKQGPNKTTLFLGPKNKARKALALWNERHGKEATRLRHFHLLEFGSSRGPAQPFLRPAFHATAVLVARNFGKELAKSIEKAAMK